MPNLEIKSSTTTLSYLKNINQYLEIVNRPRRYSDGVYKLFSICSANEALCLMY